VSFLQLTRAQLAELTDALAGQPVFFWVSRPAAPIPWNGSDLPGVDEHLASAKPAAVPAPPVVTPAKAPPRRPEPEWKPMTVDGSEHFLAITLPSRGADDYEEIWDLLKRHGFTLEPSNGKFWLRNRHKSLNFLATYATELRENHGAEFTENFERNTAHIKPVGMTAEIKEEAGDYDVTLGLQAGAATENEILNAVNTSRSYIESGREIYLVDPVKLAQLQAAHQALAGAPEAPGGLRRSHRIVRARVAEAQEILAEAAPHFQPPETWTKRSAALHELATLAPAPVPAALNDLLRPYQRLGVAWLWYLYHQQLGGILADEMGLGKTPQALALLLARKVGRVIPNAPTSAERRVTDNPPYPSLVVCPASLMENWRREAVRFTPELKVLVHHGGRRTDDIAAFAAQDLIITSYGTLTRDDELFTALEFDLIIADEAQHLKNRRTQAAQALRTLRGRGRFLLTGTPLENSLEDLRSLFEFLMPGFVGPVPSGVRGADRAWYDERLRLQTAPYILRRTKLAVAPELPEKIEQIIWCEPTDDQAALYRRMQEKTEHELMKLAATGASQGTMHLAALTQLLRLRQICCDPRLVEVGRVIPDAPKADAERRVKDNPPYRDSAKLEAFRELLAESIDEGHRMLVFSQFTSLLALLRTELEAEGVAFCYLDGSMTARARQAAVDKFQDDETVPVFLISLKAGGTGLNLTGADVVVHYDPWWNPAAEAQATDRTHRIGQTKVVTSYKLICSGTVEEKVLTLQDTKRALLADVFEASDAAAAKLSLTDLRELLKQ
ncbi:MAG: Non-specific serine/threonine protein kinase, partial [Lacunisphaera sp.]|nr:Non-specific serine/threonine protein kinase [Lacunisphaera sp.]